MSKLMLQSIKNEGSFSAEKFIQSFLDYLDGGTLIIPGFLSKINTEVPFIMSEQKPTTGGLSLQAYKWFKKGIGERTQDPLHSFFVFGNKTTEIIDYTKKSCSSFGKNSIFEHFYENKGKIVMIDLDFYHGFTFAHFVEEKLNVQYRSHETYSILNAEKEKINYQIFSKKKGYTPVLNPLEDIFIHNESMVVHSINSSNVKIIDVNSSYQFIEHDIIHNNAKNIINFDFVLYLKQTVKSLIKR